MNIKPLSNRVLIEPVEEEQTTKSGIVLPDTAEKEKQIKGRVIAAGPGKMADNGQRLPMSVKVGNVVLFRKPWSDSEIEADGKKRMLVDEDDILAIIG